MSAASTTSDSNDGSGEAYLADVKPLAFGLFAVGFGTNVATPLFLVYETRLDLSTWMLTALFAIYPLGLAPALAYAGAASDVLGRRWVVAPGLFVSALASAVMLLGRDQVALLFAGRFLLGSASGAVLVVASAWMQELGASRPMLTSRIIGLVMYGGFGLGPLIGGVFGQWGPGRLVVPYLIHISLIVIGLAVCWTIPETVTARRGQPIRPNLGIPDGSAAEFWRVLVPTAFGVFGLPSLAFGLFPVLLRSEMESVAVFVTGLVFVLAMGSIVPAQAWVGRVGPYRAAPFGLALGAGGTAVGLVALVTGAWALFFPAAILMGAASGVSMTAGLRLVDIITEPRERGALTGSFYAAAYVGMMMPLAVSTIARASSFEAVHAALVMAGVGGALWLFTATRTLRVSAMS